MNIIFVYGTLRKGFSNHEFYLSSAKFLGNAETLFGAVLYVPGLIPYLRQEGCFSVKGELYEVSDEDLKKIDALEGHPNVYYRQKGGFQLEDGTCRTGYFYDYPYNIPEHGYKTSDYAMLTEY